MNAEIYAVKTILQAVQRELTKRQAKEREGILLTHREGWSDHTAGLIVLRDSLHEQMEDLSWS